MNKIITTFLLLFVFTFPVFAVDISGRVIPTDIASYRRFIRVLLVDGTTGEGQTTDVTPFGYYQFLGLQKNHSYFMWPIVIKSTAERCVDFLPLIRVVFTLENDETGLNFEYTTREHGCLENASPFRFTKEIFPLYE